ncbi:MAG: LON peptidase substrate-binding domain-containing protein [Myxococcales bacterium]|nr:LON peptidase substrate-binding domain-containing protein [Myxococcales bacterium]
MNEEMTIELDKQALEAVPIFPLPGTVLLPHTLLSLHIFEPRYRKMMAHCIENHRIIAITMLQERGEPDAHGRPPVFSMAGLGYIRRSAKLPDGRYNAVIQGIARVLLEDEHPPAQCFRRGQAALIEDPPLKTAANCTSIRTAGHALQALCCRAFAHPNGAELLDELGQLEPGRLADTVAATVIDEVYERQRILEATDVLKRIELVSGAIGTLLLNQEFNETEPSVTETNLPRWGIVPGKA